MREIKFRGKEICEKEWIYGDLMHSITVKYGVVKRHVLIGTDFNFDAVDSKTIGQFTGLKDKNEKEVYEGDIVRWVDSDGKRRIDTVTWKNGGLVLCNSQYTVGSYIDKWLVVIGNIYDNPELLEKNIDS